MTTETGGQAFPAHFESHDGMTLRDYFASKAMLAVMGDKKTQEYWGEEYSIEEMLFFTAKRAYQQADAMLEARQA